MIYIKVYPVAGNHITDVVADSIELARKIDVGIKFSFNGANVYITKDSKRELIVQRYYNDIKETK